MKGIAEPSLALSMPKEPSELDDGLLTSSEVAQFKLNADWVVLSACNTIAGDKPGAEALSGLARSFFYAGARALLVSHWAVGSEAATRLTISTFDRLKADPKMGRAEALRQAMLGLSQRPVLAAKRLSGLLGAVCPDRRGRGALSFAIVRSANSSHGAADVARHQRKWNALPRCSKT